MSNDTAAAPLDLEATILHHIKASQKNWRGGAYALLVMGALLWLIPDGYLGKNWFWQGKLALFGIFAALGGTFLFLGLCDPLKNAGLRVVRERPGDIVWAYVFTSAQNGSVQHARVVLGLVDGKRATIPAKIGEESGLLDAVARIAPDAVLGFDPALEAAFKRDPASLRRGGVALHAA